MNRRYDGLDEPEVWSLDEPVYTRFLNECFEPNDMIKMQGKNLQLLQSVSFNFLIFLEIIILYITDFHWYFEVSIGHFWGSYKWDILFITDFYWYFEDDPWWNNDWKSSMQTFNWCWMPEEPECIHSACSKHLPGCNHYFGSIKNVKYQYLHLSDFDNNKGKVDSPQLQLKWILSLFWVGLEFRMKSQNPSAPSVVSENRSEVGKVAWICIHLCVPAVFLQTISFAHFAEFQFQNANIR